MLVLQCYSVIVLQCYSINILRIPPTKTKPAISVVTEHFFRMTFSLLQPVLENGQTEIIPTNSPSESFDDQPPPAPGTPPPPPPPPLASPE